MKRLMFNLILDFRDRKIHIIFYNQGPMPQVVYGGKFDNIKAYMHQIFESYSTILFDDGQLYAWRDPFAEPVAAGYTNNFGKDTQMIVWLDPISRTAFGTWVEATVRSR